MNLNTCAPLSWLIPIQRGRLRWFEEAYWISTPELNAQRGAPCLLKSLLVQIFTAFPFFSLSLCLGTDPLLDLPTARVKSNFGKTKIGPNFVPLFVCLDFQGVSWSLPWNRDPPASYRPRPLIHSHTRVWLVFSHCKYYTTTSVNAVWDIGCTHTYCAVWTNTCVCRMEGGNEKDERQKSQCSSVNNAEGTSCTEGLQKVGMSRPIMKLSLGAWGWVGHDKERMLWVFKVWRFNPYNLKRAFKREFPGLRVKWISWSNVSNYNLELLDS